MKSNSKLIYALSALFVLAILVASVAAADSNLANDTLKGDNFKINIPSGSEFNQQSTTNLNIDGQGFNMLVFENTADNKDVDSVLYFKDNTNDSSIISDMIKDMIKDNEVVEETDKYVILKTQNAGGWNFFGVDFGGLTDIANGFDGLFSDNSGINVSAEGSDVKLSTDGIDIDNSDNGSFSLSRNGLEFSDGDGSGVSISDKGISFSDPSSSNGSSDNVTLGESNLSFSGNINSDILNSDYVLCMENPDKNNVLLITGNNLETLKSMADTASFK